MSRTIIPLALAASLAFGGTALAQSSGGGSSGGGAAGAASPGGAPSSTAGPSGSLDRRRRRRQHDPARPHRLGARPAAAGRRDGRHDRKHRPVLERRLARDHAPAERARPRARPQPAWRQRHLPGLLTGRPAPGPASAAHPGRPGCSCAPPVRQEDSAERGATGERPPEVEHTTLAVHGFGRICG